MDQRRNNGTERDEHGAKLPQKRLDLSLPQVAGSAVAAIAAAVLASQLGVYGTIIGAGVVSVVATCGGSVFQHVFRRTGEQIRVVTVQAKPKARQVEASPLPPATAPPGPANGEFGRPTTHGTRVRGWKRPVRAAGVVFLVAMVGITGFELISGRDLSGGKGTTVGSVVGGGDRHAPSHAPANTPDPNGSRGTAPGRDGGDRTGGSTDPGTPPPTPGGGTGHDGGTTPPPAPPTPTAPPSPPATGDTPTPGGTDGTGDPGGTDGGADSGTGTGTGGDTPRSGTGSGAPDR